MDPEEIRTLEGVNKVIGYAKLDATDLKPTVQCLSFDNNLDNGSVILLEIDKSMAEQLKEGDSLTLRGEKRDSAVLCTKDKTYDMKEAETSNTLLLADNLLLDINNECEDQNIKHKKVWAMKNEYYELKLLKPKLKRLKHTLEENVYSGREYEDDENHQGHKYTYDELINIVQASDEEILTGLDKLHASVIQGKWRLLDLDFVSKILESILSLIDENSWTLDSIPLKECCDTLSEQYLSHLVKHILDTYCDVIDGDSNEDCDESNKKYSLNEDKVCKFYGEIILRDSKKFNLLEFEEVWQMSVPEAMKTSLSQLEGLVLVDRSCKPQVIKYFPVVELSEDIHERFQSLFKAKEKWSMGEVTPYIQDLTTAKVGVGALLTKHARASTQNGIKVYGSKM